MKRTIVALAGIAILAAAGCSSQPGSVDSVATAEATTVPTKRQLDAEFLDLLDRRGAIGLGDADLKVARGGEVCAALQSRKSMGRSDEVERWAAGGAIAHKPSIEVLVKTATEIYCPGFYQ